MSLLSAFLTDLDAARTAADVAETRYRAEAAAQSQALATARAHAYRRADLMASLAAATAEVETPELAVAAGQALLRGRLGWDEDSPARSEVLTRFATVALALFAAGRAAAEPEPDAQAPTEEPAEAPAETLAPAEALAAFEAWYLETRETPFWYLFDHYFPETPLVDF
jgi:hypothetical protein